MPPSPADTGPNLDWAAAATRAIKTRLTLRSDLEGYQDKAQSDLQFACMALVALGQAAPVPWGAVPLDPPRAPTDAPRWDDVACAVVALLQNRREISFRLPDGTINERPRGQFRMVRRAPPPPPNVAATALLGCAHLKPDAIATLQGIGLLDGMAWAATAHHVLWRVADRFWLGDLAEQPQVAEIIDATCATLPADVAAALSDLATITEDQIDDFLTQRTKAIAKMREEHGPNARIHDHDMTRAEAYDSILFQRPHDMDWLFFRRWRLADGWLSEPQAKRAIGIFSDPLAEAVRKAVIPKLHPKFQSDWLAYQERLAARHREPRQN
jgi:pellino protein